MEIHIDDTSIDTLTVKFWKEQPGPICPLGTPTGWACVIGPDYVGGVGGFGMTPLEALKDLCDQIARQEGYKTDGGKILLR